MNEETEKKLNAALKETGMRIDGMGILITKFDRMIEQNEKLLNTLFHLETKIEAMMSPEDMKRLEEIKRNFRKG